MRRIYTLSKNSVLNILKSIGLILLIFTAQQFVSAFSLIKENPIVAITLGIIGLIGYIGLVLWLKPFKPTEFKHKWKSHPILRFLGTVVGTYIVMAIASMIIGILKVAMNHTETTANQSAINSMASNGSIWIVVALLLSAPLFEEFAFRWVIFEKMFPKARWIAPFLTSTITFAAAHVMAGSMLDVWSWLTYLPMSIIFTALYAWRRDIVLNMSVHFVWNFVSALMMLSVMHIL